MRLFFAVLVSPDIKQGILSAIDRFPVRHPPWRWVHGENLHITLKFLGEMDQVTVPDLVSAARRACAGVHPFTLSFSRFGAFPNLRKPRVLFYSADEGSEQLQALADTLERALQESLGIEREKRPFRSHITVARIKMPLSPVLCGALESVPHLEGLSQEVGSISLMQSELMRSGAIYRPVKEIALV